MAIPRYFPQMLSIVLHRVLSSGRTLALEPPSFKNAGDLTIYLNQVVPEHSVIDGNDVNKWGVLCTEQRLGFYLVLDTTYLMVWIENGNFNVTVERASESGNLADNTLCLKTIVNQNGVLLMREMHPVSTNQDDSYMSYLMEALHHFFDSSDGMYASLVAGEEFDKALFAKASGFGQLT